MISATDAPEEVIESEAVAPLRVVLADDHALVRAGIAKSLRDAGCDVFEAGSGERAVVLLQSDRRIDVLFTDIQLGGSLSGWDVADAFRQARPHAVILYTSGNSADRRRQMPGSSFFDKPYDSAAIVKACRS